MSGCEWEHIVDVAGAIEVLRRNPNPSPSPHPDPDPSTDPNQVLRRGSENRKTACTKMNADSSRSHAVLMISISVKGGPRTLNGKLYLVDLLALALTPTRTPTLTLTPTRTLTRQALPRRPGRLRAREEVGRRGQRLRRGQGHQPVAHHPGQMHRDPRVQQEGAAAVSRE